MHKGRVLSVLATVRLDLRNCMFTDTSLVSALITFLPLTTLAAVLASCKSASKSLSAERKKLLIESKNKIAVALTDEQVQQIAIGFLDGGGYTDSEAELLHSIADYRDEEEDRSEYSGPDQAGDFASDSSFSPVACPWN